MAKRKSPTTPARRRPAVKSAKRPSVKKPPTRRATKINVLTPPRIGEQWPGQGGVYLGIIRGEPGQPDYHLIAPTDTSAVIKGPWGVTERLSSAESNRDGMANTMAMMKARSKLANAARSLFIDGHHDFYIGARDEARLAYINAREHLSKDGWLWTSTQHEFFDAYAWLQNFVSGTQNDGLKSAEYRAFVVRRLPIH